MDLGLGNRVALVTGASKGLGAAIARELVSEGAGVVLVAREPQRLEATRGELEALGRGRVWAVAGDVARLDALDRLVAAAHEAAGRLDILVTNAGGPPSGRFEELDAAAWEQAARTTLFSAVELTRRVLPGMRARRWGRILAITSISVRQPIAGLMLSNSLRAAVTGWARTLANEVAADGITVNCMLPGWTRTDRVVSLAEATASRESIAPAEVLARWERDIPMGRLGEPREFAALAAFLASERASYLTGASIAVDGGWTRGLF